MNSLEWWANCYPQWQRGPIVTTPDGRPSVQANPTVVGGMQQPGEAQRQAAAMSGSEMPNVTVVGTVMNKVDSDATEGATVADDQAMMPGGAPPDADEL